MQGVFSKTLKAYAVCMKSCRVAHAVVWHQGRLLLIEHKPKAQKNRIWRHNTDTPFWCLPGGKSEDEDCDLLATARREAREEAGVDTQESGKLIACMRFDDPKEGWSCYQETYELMAISGDLHPIADPDNAIARSAFFAKDEAISKLEQLQLQLLKEPVLAYLRGEGSALWTYRLDDDGNYILTSSEPF